MSERSESDVEEPLPEEEEVYDDSGLCDEEPNEISIRDLAWRLFSSESDIDHPSILSIAPRRSGKSYFMKHLFYWADNYPKGQFDAVFLYSGSTFNGDWSNVFPKRYQFYDWTEENALHLLSILENQRRLYDEDLNRENPTGRMPRVLVLLDDIVSGDRLYAGARGKALTTCFMRGRHVGVTTVVLLQKWRSFSALRSNADVMILFRECNRLLRKAIIEEHMTCYENTDVSSVRSAERYFEKVFKSRYHALILDQAGSHGAKYLREYTYSCKAPSEPAPDYCLGPAHHWRQTPG